ncbi:MAG: hypothetical protein HOK67_16035 [Deltaproteobacteria bacterium]|jgi:hypothetical protein|nr:hypothetical protein [Deltaproteobacteria bacterium]MBT4637378.1 hypothetical protein [Deltaproteobacteria bacterium]MBT6501407.1 hypothetical protein [Deltaproteobacteria bacterium]MBT6614129.1 hypothetical protein [Deltaproteobacteria bacterium]MBT7716095.1 hypothetical protein [Deltaproteobacteria bacterium]
MVHTQKILILLLFFLVLQGGGSPLSAQNQQHGWNGVVVKVLSPDVSIIREGTPLPAYQWGVSLYEEDEVQTGKSGKALITFSESAGGNEVLLGPSTRVRVSRTATKFDYSIYLLTVLEGKIWAKDKAEQSRKVEVNAGKSVIIPFGGEYVVEQTGAETLVSSTKGTIRMHDPSTDQYKVLPQGEIASVSEKTGELSIKLIPPKLMANFQSTSTGPGEASEEISQAIAGRQHKKEENKARKLKEKEQKNMAILAVAPAGNEATAAKEEPADPNQSKSEKATGDQNQTVADQSEDPAEQTEQSAEQAKAAPAEEAQQASQDPNAAVDEKKEEDPATETIVKQEQSAEKETLEPSITQAEPAPVQPQEEEPFWIRHKWHIVLTSTALVFAWLSAEEATQYDALATKNTTLKTAWSNASTTTERNSLEVDYEVNKAKMELNKTNVDRYNYILLIAIGLEGYLIYDDLFGDDGYFADSRQNHDKGLLKPDRIDFGLNGPTPGSGIRLSLGWNW